MKLSLPLNIKTDLKKFGSIKPFDVWCGEAICVLNMPDEEKFYNRVIDDLEKLGWNWGSNLIKNRHSGKILKHLFLLSGGRLLQCNKFCNKSNPIIDCDIGESCLSAQIDIVERENIINKPKQRLQNCLYTIPSWLNTENCCSKCGTKMEVLLNAIYCPHCD